MKRKRWLAILMGVVLIAALFPAAAAVDAAGADVAEKELEFDFGIGPRSSQDFGNSENSKDSEGSGNSENSEDFEDSGRTENSGNSKDYEGSVGYEDAGWAEESKNFVIYNEKNGYIYAISGLRGTIRMSEGCFRNSGCGNFSRYNRCGLKGGTGGEESRTGRGIALAVGG